MVETGKPAADLVARQVDMLLLEQGEYTPVELLLALGRLNYGDYERWRRNAVATLAEAVRGAHRELLELLSAAASRCAGHGLEPVTLDYPRPSGDSVLQPRAAEDAELDILLTTGFRRPIDCSQLDLFVDSRRTAAERAFTDALLCGDRAGATAALQRLMSVWSDCPERPRLEALVEHLGSPVDGSPEEQLACIRETLEPAAIAWLGATARDYLAPHWRALCASLRGMPFDAERPQCHASFPAARVGDWQLVRDAVLSESDWCRQPILLSRLWQAAEQLREPTVALDCCCLLCWDHGMHAEAALQASLFFASHYQAFLDVDAPLSVADFPAWYALVRRRPVPEPEPAHPVAACVQAVNALVNAARQVPGGAAEIAARKVLKSAYPGLLDVYLAGG